MLLILGFNIIFKIMKVTKVKKIVFRSLFL